MSNPVQGWYADPEGSDQLRWWDGTQWSDQFRPAPTGNEAASDTHPQPAAQVEEPPTDAPAPAKPAAKPIAQPPASQLITTGILGLLTFFFIAGAALAGSAYVSAGYDLQNAQSLYDQAEQTLQEAKDAAK
ncbi:DUF2510 domain-containing protein [Rothia mucilaginosa]|uniref:DUF2510 domain-containing protein n=1 Tax=Rothia mucilaginosa TaxID=43675 RepID=UPI0026ECFEB2|nr:DUF2510 domain-containing protein [Rothia mucilaginosa]